MFFIEAILRWVVVVGYALSAFLYIGPLLSPHVRTRPWATPILLLTAVLHALFILEQVVDTGRLTFLRTALQATTLYALGLAAATLFVEWRFRNRSFGAFAVPLAMLLYLLSLIERQAHAGIDPRFDTYWFEAHMMTAVVGYSAFGLAFVTAVMYLLLAKEIRRRNLGQLFSRLPSLETLDQIGQRSAATGLLFFSAALAAGAIWSSKDSGHPFAGEPKELMSLVTWAIFALQLLLRWKAGWRGRRSALLNIAGFLSVIVTTLFAGGASGRHRL